MSGFSYPQPIFISSCYNPGFYLSLDQTGYLTYAYAQTLYLGRSDYRLSYITGINPGVATPGISLVVASDRSLSGLGALSCSSLTVGGSLIVAPPSYVLSITPGTAASSKALVLDSSSNIAAINSLSASSLTGTLQTASQPNINSVNVLNVASHNGSTIGLSLGGTLITASASEVNYIDVAVGTATASKALVLDSSKGITGINSLSATTINATSIQQGGTTYDLSLLSATAGTVLNSKAVIAGSSGSISGIDSLTCTSLTMNGLSSGLSISGASGFLSISNTSASTSISTGALRVAGGGFFDANCAINASLSLISGTSILQISNTSASTSSSTGAIQCSGGAYFGAASLFASSINSASITTTGDVTANGHLAGFLSYGNQSAITDVGMMNGIGIKASYSNEFLNITGDGTNFLDGSYSRCCQFFGSNATPVGFQIEVNNGNKATSTNAAWNGTSTVNDLRLGTGGTTQMTLTSQGRLGIGTANPLYGLYVATTVSTTIDAGATGVAYFKQTGGLISTTGPISSVPIAIACAGSMLSSTAYYTYSDARLKHCFDSVEDSVCDGLLEVEPMMFKYKTDSHMTPMHIGYKAQDLLKAGLHHCVDFVSNPALEVEDESVNLKSIQFTVDYGKMSCLLHKLALKQQKQIEALEKGLNEVLQSKI